MNNFGFGYEKIRIPVYKTRIVDFKDLQGISPVADFPDYLEIDVPTLNKEVQQALAENQYQFGSLNLDSGLVILGLDAILRISHYKGDLTNFYYDTSQTIRIMDFGIIFNSGASGITVVPNPCKYRKDPKPPKEITDRERLTTAHLQAVAKVTVGLVPAKIDSEYRDGWMAAIRVMCQNIGIDVPKMIPFEGMKTVSKEEIIQKVIAEMNEK